MLQKCKDLITDNYGKEKPDMLAVYLLYHTYSENNVSNLKVPDVADKLEISKYRVRKARKKLTENGYVHERSEKEGNGLMSHYVIIS